MSRSLDLVQQETDSTQESKRERLAVLLLVNRPAQLCCFLTNIAANLAPSTPIDLYIFSKGNALQQAYTQVGCPVNVHSMYIRFMAIDEHWETPEEANDQLLWSSGFSEEYRRMGHWRLTFPMEFAANLGYEYILQLDDDSKFLEPVETNLLQYMQDNNKVMAARDVMGPDQISVITGAAELTRYFLVSEELEPATLFDYCSPQNIAGLYTPTATGPDDEYGQPELGGYKSMHLYGNCVMLNLNFWFQPNVQRFVRLVLGTGGHFRFRWNEQLVQTLVWQIFVQPEQFHLFSYPYIHGPDAKC